MQSRDQQIAELKRIFEKQGENNHLSMLGMFDYMQKNMQGEKIVLENIKTEKEIGVLPSSLFTSIRACIFTDDRVKPQFSDLPVSKDGDIQLTKEVLEKMNKDSFIRFMSCYYKTNN